MYLVINKKTLVVKHVVSFANLPGGIRSNGQHLQYADHILAEVSVLIGNAGFRLFHDETGAANGHTDVDVRYRVEGQPPTFHMYSHSEEFVPEFQSSQHNYLWPTGMWHLLQVTLAIEAHLEENLGFDPTLRKFFFDALAANKLATA